jgi:hypothetical protein
MTDLVSLFETRELIAVANQVPASGTFLQDTFFGKEEVVPSERVDIVVRKGKRTLAPFVSPKVAGKVVKTSTQTVRTYKPAYIKEKWVTEAEDIIGKTENVFYAENNSISEVLAERITRETQEHKENLVRRVEWMSSQVLTTGKVEVKGEGVEEVIDFGFDSNQFVVLTDNTWDSDTVDPIAMMREWRRERVKAGGIAPNVAVFGSEAIDAFINNAKVKDALDMRRMDRGMINPEVLPQGVTYWGYIPEIATDIYSYDEWYIDENGNEKPMVPTKGVVYGSDKTQAKRVYGAIKDLRALTATKFFLKSWEVEDPSARFMLLQSAPLVVPTEVDAFMYAEVLA